MLINIYDMLQNIKQIVHESLRYTFYILHTKPITHKSECGFPSIEHVVYIRMNTATVLRLTSREGTDNNGHHVVSSESMWNFFKRTSRQSFSFVYLYGQS